MSETAPVAPVSSERESTSAAFVELTRRAGMLDAVGYAATLLVGASDWRAGIEELLRRLGLATGVSRVSLFEAHRSATGEVAQSCRFDWAEPPLESISSDPRYSEMTLGDAKN